MYIVYEKDGKTPKCSHKDKNVLLRLGYSSDSIKEKKTDPFAIKPPTKKEIRIAEIKKRLDQLVLASVKNDTFYKEKDQSTLKVTWQDKHNEIVKEREELITELDSLTK